MQQDTLFAIPSHWPQQHLQHQPVRPRPDPPRAFRTRLSLPRPPRTRPGRAQSPIIPADPDETAVGYPARREDYSRNVRAKRAAPGAATASDPG